MQNIISIYFLHVLILCRAIDVLSQQQQQRSTPSSSRRIKRNKNISSNRKGINRGRQMQDTWIYNQESWDGSSNGKGKGKGKGSRKEPSSQPTEKFDLSKCELYANLWILDLTESCIGDPLENNFLGCQCTDAEYRIDLGQIDCGQHLCPEDCEVCKTCLYYVIDDCVKAEPITYTEGPSSSPLSI